MSKLYYFLIVLFVVQLSLYSPDVNAGEYQYDFDLGKLYTTTEANTTSAEFLGSLTGQYRNLISEMGVVFAPSFLSPAETLGFSGFAVNLFYGLNTVSSSSDYWQNGISGSPSTLVGTLGFEFRKGMWFPLPGFEIGGGVKYLPNSHMYAPHVMAKFALVEGYFKWPFPAVAVRGYGTRVMGSRDVDITLASIDISFSKSFGLNSTINLTPYGGYNYLMIIGDSKKVYIPGGIGGDPTLTEYVFDDQDVIVRHRLFLGTRLKYHKLVFTFEAVFTFKGSSGDSVDGSGGNLIVVKDQSSLQQTYTLSVGWDF
jgi:hypothetical protein